MADTPITAQTDTGPAQINTPPYPGTTKIENGQAYDVSGKALGAVDDSGAAVGAAPKAPVDYDALAKQAGSVGSAPSVKAPVDYDALAKQAGSVGSIPSKGAVDYDALAKQAGSTGSAPAGLPPSTIGPRPTGTKSWIDEKLGLPSPQEFSNWLEDLEGDVRNGTSATKIGALLKWMGAKGTSYGVPESVGNVMAGPALGIPETLHGVMQAPEHPTRGINEIISGAGTTLGPAAMLAPEAIPFVAAGSVGQKVGSATAAAFGADEDTQELVGNVSGLLAGGATVKKSHLQGFEAAVDARMTADKIYDTRIREVGVARQQAVEAAQRAQEAAQAEVSGAGTRDQTVQARNTASEAAANASKAQEALKLAEENKAKAAVAVTQAGRTITQAIKPKVKPKVEVKAGTPEEVAKSIDDFQKAVPPGTGKSAYTPKDAQNVRPILEKAHATSVVDSPQDVVDSLESDRVSRDNEVRGLVRDNGKYANEPLLLTDDGGNPVSVKQRVVDALSEDEKTRPGFTEAALKELERFNTTDPTLDEADRLRETLNSENRDKLNTPQGKRAISDARETDPEFAARYELQDILRDGIYGRLEEKGVKNARESRQLDASVIRVRNAAERQIRNADKVVRGTSDVGAFRKGAAKVSTYAGTAAGAAAGVATGIPGAPEVLGMAGAGLGKVVGERIAPPDLTRGALIKRSLDVKHPAVEIPRVDVTGAKPSAPPTEPLPPAVEIPSAPVNPRENTEIHAALATHYDEQIGDTPYSELEDRFLSDIATKKKYNVPLDPAEKKINKEINKSKVDEILKARGLAEEQKKAAQKVADDAEKEKKEKLDIGMPLSIGPPFEVADSDLTIPKKYAEMGYTPQRIRAHEAGHIVLLHDAGFIPQDIISHLHKDVEGNIAAARWNDEEFRDADGRMDVEKIRNKLPEILASIYGGSVAEEMLHGIPVHSNPGAAGDIKLANHLMDLVNVPASERGATLKIAELKARGVLTKPGVIDTVKKYTESRKSGLSDDLHMDPETVGAMTQEIKNLGGNNGTDNNNQASGKDGGLGKESNTRGKGGVPSKTERTARLAGEAGEGIGGKGKLNIAQGGHAGGGVASVEELARPGRFVKISRSGMPTDQGKTPDFNLAEGEAGYQVKPDGTYELAAGQETPATKRGVEGYLKSLKMPIKGPEAPPITEVIPELKNHPELAQRMKDLGFEGVLQKEWMRQERERLKAEPVIKTEGSTIPPPVERSTGVPEIDSAIKAGGGVPGGISDFGEFGKIYNFHDPMTGSTLGFREGKEITPETVKAQIQKSREAFGLPVEK